MADIRQSGYQVQDGYGAVLYEAYGVEAETDCANWLQRNRPATFRVVSAARVINTRDAELAEAERVAALLSSSLGVQVYPGREAEQLNEIERDGYNLGASFAKLMAPGGTADSSSLINIGMFFSELRGYRDLRTGNAYVSAFARGFQENNAGAAIDLSRRLNGASGDSVDSKSSGPGSDPD